MHVHSLSSGVVPVPAAKRPEAIETVAECYFSVAAHVLVRASVPVHARVRGLYHIDEWMTELEKVHARSLPVVAQSLHPRRDQSAGCDLHYVRAQVVAFRSDGLARRDGQDR